MVPAVVGSIVVVSALTRCALLLENCGLIRKFILYKFELGHNVADATKNICSEKGKGTVDCSTMSRWLKKFLLGCKNALGRPKTVDSKIVFQDKSGEYHLKSIRQARYLTVYRVSSPSRPRQNYPKLPNCASRYQYILTQPNMLWFFHRQMIRLRYQDHT